jgi:hypothetical protein
MYGCGKEDIKSMDLGVSYLGGNTLNDTKMFRQLNRANTKNTNENNNLKQSDSQIFHNEKKSERVVDYDNVYNNDLYFCLDFNHFWKLIREFGLITTEFSLAMLDRVCFQNPDNVIEMFYIPEDLACKNNIKEEKDIIYDYIFKKIEKSKTDFENKYQAQIKQSQILVYGNEVNNTKEEEKKEKDTKEEEKKIDDNDKDTNKKEYENNINYHDEKNVILLRFFYEIIIRLAYIKYSDNPEMNLVAKVKALIEEIKAFLRIRLKSGTAESSIYSAMLSIDPKLKNVEATLEKFISDNNIILNKIFVELYEYSCDNEHLYKPYDITLTYRFFYDNIIATSEALSKIFKNKMEYIDIISLYIKDKKITSSNLDAMTETYKPYEILEYIDKLLDTEMIFREFCELVFFISRKYFIFYGINKEEEEKEIIISSNKSKISIKNEEKKRKSNKMIINKRLIKEDKDKEKEKEKEIKDTIDNKDNNNYKIVINYIIQEKDKLKEQDKYVGVNSYVYPVLKTHQTITKLIENEKKRKIEEEKREKERQRFTFERNLLKDEDLNVYREEEEQENSSESLEEDMY